MITSLMYVSVFVLILLNLFAAQFIYIAGILDFPISFAISVMSDVYLIYLFQQMKFQSFKKMLCLL